MADPYKSTPASFADPNPSLSRSIAPDGTKRRKVECSHPLICEGECLKCERAVDDDDHSLPFGFLHPSLRLSYEYADRIREVITTAALEMKKLHLVLDLDHTLLHTIRLSNLTPEEEERLKPEAERNAEGGVEGGGDVFLVESETSEGFITKLRPFVREFLREADQMFQLTVYTMGGRVYSSRMTKLLDPDGKYFSDRVIAREDCTLRGRKNLDMVLAKESNILIMDDTESVWPDHTDNLIAIEPFYYFSHGSKRRRARPGSDHDEGEQDSMLATALQFLKEIHRSYFDSKLGLEGGDVREVMQQMQTRVPGTSDDQAPPGDVM
ncbi:RNA polymerase II C-terminal domain phosphatase-like 4 [Syzygium oleosum]|uniref:RNA polymerase II C-terminal domain phosphatase-like 4 n=1 Tax=Syzygium oleosum TaxID=219896 RepID=UPI0011D1D624|nr:RNA polymerase II C-terminal domain phosphatase-like 4 [Syzygium oleosum]